MKVRENSYEDITIGPAHMQVREQTYWDDITEGMELPPIPIELNWTEMAKQVSGSQDFNPLHHDVDFARSQGHGNPFMNTRWHEGWFSRLLHDFTGPEGWPRKFHMEMRRTNELGDKITFNGKVVSKYEADGQHLADLELWIDNERHPVPASIATATVWLPTRS